MGYNTLTQTTTLTAKLTPLGRQRMMSNNNGLIKSFSLGDSDANYNTKSILISGEIPSIGGEIGVNNTINNSSSKITTLRSKLIVNSDGGENKAVSTNSSSVFTETISNGLTSIDFNFIEKNVVNRSSINNSLVNLFNTFGLPLNAVDDTLYSTILSKDGGFANTAYSGIGATQILVIAIDNSKYGEIIDGKVFKLNIPTPSTNYTLYTTFEGGINNLVKMDVMVGDSSLTVKKYGDNVAMLVCDQIRKPKGNINLSWSTGYNNIKPFSLNNKETFNVKTIPNLGVVVDELVGMVFLDKGFAVITNQTIVNDFINSGTNDGITVEFDSLSTNVCQNITCIADRGEFGSSTNKTFNLGDTPRISEVGLYDSNGSLMAIAKTDRHILKNINEFLALGIKIVV
jgi:hypothetical protein